MKTKILAVGGGSGGHVTPVVAVLRELEKRNGAIEIRFWCDRGFAPQAKGIIAQFDPQIRVDTITAGKFRRYRHLSFLQHFTTLSILWPNIRDLFLVIAGTFQSIFKLIVWRPDVVFTKGGYVCLPVGWAARLLRIPLVIHDSDAHPGLTNRLLARHATAIATGAPLEYYSYPEKKTRYIGIPINSDFHIFTVAERKAAKQALDLDPLRPLLVVTGGGLGSKVINDTVLFNLPRLLEHTNVILISGRDQYDELRALAPRDESRFQLYDFVSTGMVDMLGAADIVVSRAGATTMLELAALAKPTILIPSSRLTWQMKHAKTYSDEDAVVLIDETKLDNATASPLVKAIEQLAGDRRRQLALARNIHAFAKPHAASDMAAMILRAAGVKSRRSSGTIDHK